MCNAEALFEKGERLVFFRVFFAFQISDEVMEGFGSRHVFILPLNIADNGVVSIFGKTE